MSILLEIIGTGFNIDTTALMWQWFDVSGTIACSLPQEKQEQLYTVIDLASNNRTEKACEKLRLYLFENPSCVLGRMAAGALCIQKNQPAEAIEEFNSVYMRQPSNTMVLYAIGHCYERLGNESQAVEFYQDCIKFKNFLRLPRQRLAAIYFKNGRFADTIAEYEMLRSEYPDDIRTLVVLGFLYIITENFDKAADSFNTAILIHPDNFMADNDELEQLIRQENLTDALEQIQQQIQYHPDKAELFLKQGDILAMLGETNEAVVCYEYALKLCPNLLEATIKLGTQYLQMQQDDLAAMQFNLAFEMNDRVVDAYIGLSAAKKLAGKINEAKETLSLAAAIQPNSAVLFAQTAAIRFKINESPYSSSDTRNDDNVELSDIINAHRNELSCQPNNPDLLYRIGLLIMSIGDYPEAIKAFRRVLELNSSFDRARNKLITCLYETKQTDAALQLLQGPADINNQSLELHYKTAVLYCDRIKFASSLMNLENFMRSNLADFDATTNVSVVLQNLGLLDRTIATWENLSDTAVRNSDNDTFGPQASF